MPQTIQEEKMALSLNLKNKKEYQRDPMQTYLTTPEWFSVDVAQEYAQFINHTPFYEYPYFENIEKYWNVFGKSWQQAAQESGNLKVLASPYTAMNLFIGIMMTVEYGAKGLVSLPMKWAYSGQEAGNIQLLV